MTGVDIEAVRGLLARVEAAGQPNIHLDIELWVQFGLAERRDREWSDRLPTDPDERCNGLDMGEAIAAGWPAADIRTTWKVPALTSSLDAAVALVERICVARKLEIGIYPTGYVATLCWYPDGLWGDASVDAVGESRASPAIALVSALLRALIARAEAGDRT